MLLTFSMPVVPAEAALTCVKDWSDKMKISELIRKLDYHFNTLKGEAITDPAKARELRGTTISGIVNDSRKVIKDSLFFCIVGLIMSFGGLPQSPLILAFILGPTLESNMLKAFQNTGTISTFFTRPLSCIFMIIGIACVFSPILKAVFAKIKGKKA